MTSILTNNAALAALSTMRSIDNQMEMVQRRISSGYRVENAADNAAYWSIATTMRSDNSALSTTEDALGLAAAKADTAYSGLDAAITLITSIKSKLVAASGAGGSQNEKINQELTELKNQLVSVAQSSSFSGENWLYNDSTIALGVKSMVGSVNRGADGTVAVQMINFDAASSVLVDKSIAGRGLLTKGVEVQTTVSTSTSGTISVVKIPVTYFLINVKSTTGASGTEIALSSATSEESVNSMLLAVESMLKQLTDSAANLGATKARIAMQSTFVKNLVGTIEKGVGRLVDADMNEESTRLKALQTQQQLGIQSLSIANTTAANILQLFRQ